MEKTKNVWLQVNTNKINSLMLKMEEERFKSTYQGQLDLGTVIFLMKGMVYEIQNLQNQVDELKQKQGS
jgi:hypothetical protein